MSLADCGVEQPLVTVMVRVTVELSSSACAVYVGVSVSPFVIVPSPSCDQAIVPFVAVASAPVKVYAAFEQIVCATLFTTAVGSGVISIV